MTEGGRADGQTVVAGHGWRYSSTDDIVVPEGTYVHWYVEDGEGLADSIGRKVENGARNVKPRQTYGPGDRMPNYTVGPPTRPGLNIMSGSRTVDVPTFMSDLFADPEFRGIIHMAICRKWLW